MVFGAISQLKRIPTVWSIFHLVDATAILIPKILRENLKVAFCLHVCNKKKRN